MRVDCPYCEIRDYRIIDRHDRIGECDNCGFTGRCDQCDNEIEDPQLIDDPRHCSDECAHRTALENAADAAYSAWKENR